MAVTHPMRGASPGASSRAEPRALLLWGDLAVAVIGVTVALRVWCITAGFAFDAAFLASHASWYLFVPAWVAALAPTRQLRTALSLRATGRVLVRAAALFGAAYLLLFFYAPREALPRLVALYIAWEALLLTTAWRFIYQTLFYRAGLHQPTAILGDGAPASAALSLVRECVPEAEVVAMLRPGSTAGQDSPLDPAVPHHDGVIAVCAALSDTSLAEVILAGTPVDAVLEELLRCQERGMAVTPLVVLYEERLRRIPVGLLDHAWFVSSLPEAIRGGDMSWLGKRLLDILGGLAGCVLLALVGPLIALAVVLESGRPVLYEQPRLGRAGRLFRVHKFRTMRQDAEAEGPQYASRADPRVTRVGRWLRRTRLDELPQFLAVVRGEMSLVGPRPERPEFVARLESAIPFYRARLMVTPGLTGWAQICLPYASSTADHARKVEYDLYYIKHRSLAFDLAIIVRTLSVILQGAGA